MRDNDESMYCPVCGAKCKQGVCTNVDCTE